MREMGLNEEDAEDKHRLGYKMAMVISIISNKLSVQEQTGLKRTNS